MGRKEEGVKNSNAWEETLLSLESEDEDASSVS